VGKKLKFKDLLSRFEGVSTPLAGLQWQTSKSELARAKSVINFLEDRRVLYNPTELEMPDHCISSIIEIRHYLTQEIDGLSDKSQLKLTLKTMRAACRKFLDSSPTPHDGHYPGYSTWVFYSNLGWLRGVFGSSLKEIVLACELEVEEDLASIIPGQTTQI
jgi:hypothetical protein